MQVMRLFGKKANQQSAMADIPPELRPYYREQAVAARVRRTMVRVLVTVVALAILAGGGTWIGLHRHNLKIGTGSKHPAVTQQQFAAQPNAPQRSGSQPNTSQSSSTNSSQTPVPNTPPSGNSPGSNASHPSQPATGNSTPPAPDTSPQPATNPAPIPNTGPGGSVLVIGVVMAVAGVAAYRVHQKRTVRF